ncbi:MAG: ParB/RepB/Spo0J family partition protein [Alphaproteobacteria bacterium]|jgi:ParB family chromosome partitioning protein|nr:ParB/RepB/Spo0J family partition protein [Alphaproteobacteria bacterium]
MMDDGKRRGLGRGLSALLDDDTDDYAGLEPTRQTRDVPIENLRANPRQPRRRFDPAELAGLADSIRANGILQPVLARPAGGDSLEIVAGERRWRAAQLAGVHAIPVLVREISDTEAVELALIENIQREDLTPIEEAEAYQQLLDDHGQTQDGIAEMIGKSRSHVANMVRLLGLPGPIRGMLEDGRLTAGHARALIGREDALHLAERIVARGLNVRQVEDLVRKESQPKIVRRPESTPADANTRDLERRLGEALGLKVQVRHTGEAGGEVRIRYRDLDQLDEVCRRLGLRDDG